MPDAPYSNRELDSKFVHLGEKVEEGFKDVTRLIEGIRDHEIKPMHIQVKATNGRVTVLEGWRGNMQGAWKLATWIGIPLFAIWVGFVSWSTTELLKLKDTVRDTPQVVREAVANELSTLEIQITE